MLQGRVDCGMSVRQKAYTRSPGCAADFSRMEFGAAVADKRRAPYRGYARASA